MEEWLKGAGATGLGELELAEFPVTGRGVRTLRAFKEGERILSIPSDALWSVEHAHSDPLLGPVLRSAHPALSVEDTLALYLLFVRSREAGYEGLRSHVAALPASYSSSIFFTPEELEVCAGSSLYTVTKELDQRLQDDYQNLVVQVLGHSRDLFPLDKFTIDDYKWALVTVWSRSMDFELPDGRSLRVLAPFADMLNHSSVVKQCHAYDVSSGSLSVFAGKDYEAGDQVFIHYGAVPNNRLLRLYGFVLPENPNDSYDLVLSTHPSAPFFEQKQKLWEAAGLETIPTISLTRNVPLPTSVLRYLRIQRLDAHDLAAALVSPQSNLATEKVSRSNEVEILRFLADSISSILDSFGTQEKQLEKQLADGVYASGGNAWAAAHVSMGEQRVLRSARRRAHELLAAVERGGGDDERLKASATVVTMQCGNCGNSPGRLMLCGRCRAVGYCGRACQVAHFKSHKASCRPVASQVRQLT